jgi:sterol 24-C-methyltransferase
MCSYYILTSHNLEYSWGEAFHFCRFTKGPGETIDAAQRHHEHFMALMTGMKPGMRVLDAGCGIGGPVREMARFAGVRITGLTINQRHVDRAREITHAWRDHLGEGQVDFAQGDFMDMPFEDSTFDVVYSMEATVYAPDLAKCYAEIARVLKPGGVFGTYEWLLTKNFTPENSRHVELRQRIERGDGVTNLITVPEGIAAVSKAGLEMEHHEDLDQRPDPYPWWWAINGETSKAACWKDWELVFRLKKSFFDVLTWWVGFNEARGWIPRGMSEALKTQGMSVWGMLEGAQEGVFTPMYMMLARKPKDWKKPEL